MDQQLFVIQKPCLNPVFVRGLSDLQELNELSQVWVMACEPAMQSVVPSFDHIGHARSIVVELAPDAFDNCVCHPKALLESCFDQSTE